MFSLTFRHFCYQLTTVCDVTHLSEYLKLHLTHHCTGSRAALPQTAWEADEDIRLPENGVQDSGERCSSSGDELSLYLWC